MKIISKFKDYYDYYKGILGVDPVLIYDRRKDWIIKFKANLDFNVKYRWMATGISTHVFFICNKIYTLYEYEGKLYYASNLEEVNKLNLKLLKGDRKVYYINRNLKGFLHIKTITNKNKKQREPVLYKGPLLWDDDEKTSIPILDSFDFAKIIPAKEMYIKISNFLGWLNDNPPIESNMTSLEKILSHGFDMKISFRHRKK